MKPLQIMIEVLFVFKIYNHIKCTMYENFADNDCVITCIVLKRYNHVKCTTYETVADNDCDVICTCSKEIQPRKMYNI